MLQAMRRSMIITFWAFLLFALAYIALGRITDPRSPFDSVARQHQEVNTAFTTLVYGGESVLCVMLLGGLPVLFIVFKRAFAARGVGALAIFKLRAKWLLRLLGGALLCGIGLPGTIIGTELLFGGPPSTVGQQASIPSTPQGMLLAGVVLLGGVTLGFFAPGVIAGALSAAVARSEFGPKLLAFVLATMVASALGMGVTTVATVTWLVRFWLDAPQVAMSNAVLGNVGLAWAAIASAAMVAATITAGLASWSGWHARLHRAVVA